MEQNSIIISEESFEESTSPEPHTRKLSAEQMLEFRERVAKEMQLRAQRSVPEAQRSTTRSLQARRRREYGGTVLRNIRRRGR